ncbi:MAG: GSCFA domain-containing protein [Bacteroidales bacterium]|nr:GSCFA domain-containing protein [Bacteroidales bacterium]
MEQTITYGDGLLFLGSCFADEVGALCRGMGFDALVNPFGVLYNPISIANAVHRLANGRSFTHEEVIRTGEEYYCTFSHNTAFWQPTEEALLESVNASLLSAHKHFQTARWVVVSLGTSWVYRSLETLEVVANCHKLPSCLFDRICLSVSTSVAVLSGLAKMYPDKQFIFTVSPLRHVKDGMHGNQVSKAALLLAVDEVCKTFDNAHYFPAYEILLDELRDYRFYKEDMVHPTEQAVRHIWERFVDFAIDPSEKPAMKAAAEVKQMLQHKPVFPESESFKRFERQKEEKINELRRAFPKVCLELLPES